MKRSNILFVAIAMTLTLTACGAPNPKPGDLIGPGDCVAKEKAPGEGPRCVYGPPRANTPQTPQGKALEQDPDPKTPYLSWAVLKTKTQCKLKYTLYRNEAGLYRAIRSTEPKQEASEFKAEKKDFQYTNAGGKKAYGSLILLAECDQPTNLEWEVVTNRANQYDMDIELGLTNSNNTLDELLKHRPLRPKGYEGNEFAKGIMLYLTIRKLED